MSLRTVAGAESSATAPAPLRRNLPQVNRLCRARAEAMDDAFVGPWLDQPNEMLTGLKPIEAIERGQHSALGHRSDTTGPENKQGRRMCSSALLMLFEKPGILSSTLPAAWTMRPVR